MREIVVLNARILSCRKVLSTPSLGITLSHYVAVPVKKLELSTPSLGIT